MKKQILTREQAIKKTLEYIDVSNWDADTMREYIEEHLGGMLRKLTDEELTQELAGEWSNGFDGDDNCPYIVDESPTARVLYE